MSSSPLCNDIPPQSTTAQVMYDRILHVVLLVSFFSYLLLLFALFAELDGPFFSQTLVVSQSLTQRSLDFKITVGLFARVILVIG